MYKNTETIYIEIYSYIMQMCQCVYVCLCQCMYVDVFSSDTLEWHLRAETRRPSSMMEVCMPCQRQYVCM